MLIFVVIKVFGFKLLLKVVALVVVRLLTQTLNHSIETASAKFVHDVERGGFCQIARRAWFVLLDEGVHLRVPLRFQSDAPLMVAL